MMSERDRQRQGERQVKEAMRAIQEDADQRKKDLLRAHYEAERDLLGEVGLFGGHLGWCSGLFGGGCDCGKEA